MEIQYTKDKFDFISFIKTQKNAKNLIYKSLKNQEIRTILECGQLAQSGIDNPSWKVYIVIHPTVKLMLTELADDENRTLIEDAYVNFLIFLDLEKSKDQVKDIQSIGAFMQNVQLYALNQELGVVRVEIIPEKKVEVPKIFKLNPENWELICIFAVGGIGEIKSEVRDLSPIDKFIEWL